MQRRRILLFAIAFATLLLALASCAMRRPEPAAGFAQRPGALLLDQVHGNGTQGFVFLPPLVPEPNVALTFDATLAPTVQIDRIDPTTGADIGLVAVFGPKIGTGGVKTTVAPTGNHYQVNWDTSKFQLAVGTTCRIRVSAHHILLGLADVQLVSDGKALKNLKSTEVIGLVDGKTLPIKFRIAPGAVPELPAAVHVAVANAGGQPIAGAVVRIGAFWHTTDAAGHAEFVALPAGPIVVQVGASGYAPAAAALTVAAGSTTTVPVQLVAVDGTTTFLASQAGSLSAAGASVTVPAGAAIDALGQPVEGAMQLSVAALAAGEISAAPGSFIGLAPGSTTPTPFRSAFLADVTLAQNGVPLQLAPGMTATLVYTLPDSLQATYAVGEVLPAAWFDAMAGVWRQEGSGAIVLQTDGKKGWQAQIAHFTWWTVWVPVAQQACLDVTVKMAGEPVDAFLQVQSIDPPVFFAGGDAPDGIASGIVVPSGVALTVQATTAFGLSDTAQVTAAAGSTCTAVAIAVSCLGSGQCEDGEACTTDTCDAGICSHTNRDGACDDNIACTTGNTCQAGVCSTPTGTASTACDDQNACTIDYCDTTQGCVHVAVVGVPGCTGCLPGTDGGSFADTPSGGQDGFTGYYDILDGGVVNDSSDAGGSGGAQVICGATPADIDSDGVPNDQDNCPTTYNPLQENMLLASSPVGDACRCDTVACPTDGCHVSACTPQTGLCQTQTANEGGGCDDGNSCTQGETCAVGLCTDASPVVCTASDQCHVAGTCDPSQGCSNPAKADGVTCDDGNWCTDLDTCSAGTCVSGLAKGCDDGNGCSADGCAMVNLATDGPWELNATCKNDSVAALTVLHSFTGTDGDTPWSSLIQGFDGNFYGTTTSGGAALKGNVFKMAANGTLTVLHAFDGTDGAYPYAGLAQGADGKLYGTTNEGGASGQGTMFRIGSDGAGFEPLHEFAGAGGSEPYARVIEGSPGTFYGTTSVGGANASGGNGPGTVFKIAADGTAFQVLHSFNGTDGSYPYGSLLQVVDPVANTTFLYGTTITGGIFGRGTVFKIGTDGTGFEVVHAFGSIANDGSYPYAGLIQGSDGKLYGTTYQGGVFDYGTVFRVDGSVVSVLHSFAQASFALLSSNPLAGLVQGGDGSLYGTTPGGYYGTIFKLDASNNLTVLHEFTGPDGGAPAELVLGADGRLYGSAQSGVFWHGTLFRLALAPPDGTSCPGGTCSVGTCQP